MLNDDGVCSRCVDRLNGRSIKKEKERTRKLCSNIGDGKYVYLIRAENGLYKIGHSNNEYRRLSDIRTNSPLDAELVYSWWCHDYRELESYLHDLFSHCRIRGEWFDLEDKQVQRIITLSETE